MSETEFWRNYFYRISVLRETLRVEPLHLSPLNHKAASAQRDGENDKGDEGDSRKSDAKSPSSAPDVGAGESVNGTTNKLKVL